MMPYADIYPNHPSQILANADGYKPIKPHADRWTGKSAKVMEDKMRKIWEQKAMDNAMARRELKLGHCTTTKRSCSLIVRTTHVSLLLFCAIVITRRPV